jgi:undecaprenyl diphosphate synthase
MDGNGRWARQRGLPRIEGHRQGVQNVLRIVDAANDLDIKYLTLYAFSVENWQRPPDEVSALMHLLEIFLNQYTSKLIERKVRLHIIGDIEALPQFAQLPINNAVNATAHFTEHSLILALNYGARTEVLKAIQAYVADVQSGKADVDSLDWPTFAGYLTTKGIPDPDLIIRTSGENRLSNFLLLQSAYSEMYFSPVLWPDFGAEQLGEAVNAFAHRERRFGKTGEQIKQT